MIPKSSEFYLELIKKTLLFTLWTEPPIPMMDFNYLNPPIKKFIIKIISKILAKKQVLLVKKKKFNGKTKKIWGNMAWLCTYYDRA